LAAAVLGWYGHKASARIQTWGEKMNEQGAIFQSVATAEEMSGLPKQLSPQALKQPLSSPPAGGGRPVSYSGVRVAASCVLGQDQPPALISLSLERARFCELVAPLVGENSTEQFMLGLL
jgi:hypothetical protein